MKRPLKRIAIAPNGFKGTLTASEAAQCIERGLKKVLPDVETVKVPMADGGEGTVAAIVEVTRGEWLEALVHDPLGRKITASFGVTGDGLTAVIEMAAASGLALLKKGELNPLRASTRGTGELIRMALDCRVLRLLIGIGGSATSDGGMGMARALGARFLDQRGCELPEGGGSLVSLAHIDTSALDPRLQSTKIEVACDVANPLCGPRGAARVYGPQKGATPAQVKTLEAGLQRLATVAAKDLGVNVLRLPGAGAAGGLGAGLVAFLKGKLRPGADMVISAVDLRRRLAGCDLVITGEGRLDGQTVFGKAPVAVAKVAKERRLPVIALCGCLGPGAERTLAHGIDAYFAALDEPMSEAELRVQAPRMLEGCAEQVGRLIRIARRF